jgi:Domain of unknown function (DUF397)
MDLKELDWRKASRSGEDQGNCVEVAVDWRKANRSTEDQGNCVEVAGYQVHSA